MILTTLKEENTPYLLEKTENMKSEASRVTLGPKA